MDESAWETVVVGTWTTGTPLYGGLETGDITHGTAAEGDHQTVPDQGAHLPSSIAPMVLMFLTDHLLTCSAGRRPAGGGLNIYACPRRRRLLSLPP